MKQKIFFVVKRVIISICILILTFFALHILIIGPVYSGAFRCSGLNSRAISEEEMLEVSANMYKIGNYLYSATNDPQTKIQISDKETKYKYIRLDIENLSEAYSILQIYFINEEGIFDVQSIKIIQGINIICLNQQNFDYLRLDLTTNPNVYFLINELVFTDNYFLALPPYFWIMYALLNAVIFTCAWLIGNESRRCSADKIIDRIVDSQYITELRQALANHSKAIFLGGVIVFAIFGYEIFNFTISVDEERELSHSYGTTHNIEKMLFEEGRYGQYLLRLLFTYDRSPNPYIDVLIAVTLLFFAAVITVICIEKYYGKPLSNASVTVFIGMFSSLPYIVTEWMCYFGMNACFAFALLLCALSAYAASFKGHPIPRYCVSIVMTVLAFTISETFLAYFIALACYCVFFSIFGDENSGIKQFFNKVFPLLGTFISSFVIYMLIRLIIGTNNYTNYFFKWDKQSFSEIIHNWMAFLITLFNNTIPGSKTAAISVICFIFMTVVIALSGKSAKRFFMMLLCAGCCVAGVFSLNIVLGGSTPFRTMLSLMLFTGAPWIMALEFFGRYGKTIRLFPLALASWIIIQQGITVTRIFYGANECSKLDMEMGYEIGTQISQIESSSEKPVAIVGKYQHHSPLVIKIDAVGQSIFYRGRSTYYLIYLRLLGFEFIQADSGELTKAEGLATDMPSYPSEGSVQEFDDIIVVKLS